jgi:hypothetical protein
MATWQRNYNARQVAETKQRVENKRPYVPDPEHALPDAITAGLVDALGAPRRARERWVAGDQGGAMLQGLIDAPGLYFDGALIKGLLKKGGFKFSAPFEWSKPPWEQAGASKWLKESGFVNPFEHGHHWAIPQNGWGKIIPDFIKNQPWNIKGMDVVPHRRTHGRAKVEGQWLPEFNALEKLWFSTPAYFKALIGKGATDLVSSQGDEDHRGPGLAIPK